MVVIVRQVKLLGPLKEVGLNLEAVLLRTGLPEPPVVQIFPDHLRRGPKGIFTVPPAITNYSYCTTTMFNHLKIVSQGSTFHSTYCFLTVFQTKKGPECLQPRPLLRPTEHTQTHLTTVPLSLNNPTYKLYMEDTN